MINTIIKYVYVKLKIQWDILMKSFKFQLRFSIEKLEVQILGYEIKPVLGIFKVIDSITIFIKTNITVIKLFSIDQAYHRMQHKQNHSWDFPIFHNLNLGIEL